MHILRTRFKKEIVAEFLPPSRMLKENKVIIFCQGMPSGSSKKDLLEFFSKKGYWVFHPRYRGSWESGGEFLKLSPHQDILDIIEQLPKGFRSAWDGKLFKVNPDKVYLFGSSFGGPAAILASGYPLVDKVVVFSPVIDWRSPSKVEPLDQLGRFVKTGFGEAYRFPIKNWNKLKNGKFYNPIAETKDIDGKKIFIIHAKDDEVVSYIPSKKFSEKTGCKLVLLKKGGHLSAKNFIKKSFYKKIRWFIKE
ncbi:MAG: prolyl oligopeptidase family serine peptidase [Parcubacteria group bacterium]|nr:prolyl oligopeptidase family serine peptidase [Parcubacteria group bacterium]MCR4342317.1 prolyl oligopeptidase family serine peptidase [Patescibacteria group bacterium]